MERAMRVTTKGQVTIPAAIREKAGMLPHTEVEFVYEDGTVQLLRATKRKSKAKTRGEQLIEHLREAGRKYPSKLTTDEIMAMTRGED
jgi:AbrB family looped-hinge helix DNA binding protein